MKSDFKTISVLEVAYINLSEQLREELELKIEQVYTQNQFSRYANSPILSYKNAANPDFLYAYLIAGAPDKYELSGNLLQGIKTWFNMYYDDRLSVINKFRIYYQKVKPFEELNDTPGSSIVFCKFLISELLSILADTHWQGLIIHAN